MLERYQLRYFLAVVDAGNFSRGAAQVNVTQPTLSLGIAKLEQAVGAKLFVRNSHRVNLTSEGARFLIHARAIESEFNALSRFNAQEAGAPLRVGVLATIPTSIVRDLVTGNNTSGAPHQLEIVEGSERELLSRLERRRLDVAVTILRRGEPRFSSEVLFEEGYSLAVPETHWARGREIVAAEDLAGETMIVRRHCEVLAETSRHFTDRGVRPRFSYRSTNDDRTLALVRAGLGVTLMPDSYASADEGWPKLATFEYSRTVGLLYGDADLAGQNTGVFRALRRLGDRSSTAGK